MMILKKIISAIYAMHGKSKFNDAYTSTILLVVALQQFWLFTGIAILKKKYFNDFSIFLGKEFYFIPISIVWAVIFFRVYPRRRVQEFISEFMEESKTHRVFWMGLSAVLISIPFLIVLFYL